MAEPRRRSEAADFTFLRELGRGSWGTVLLAKRHRDGQLYAVKVVEIASMCRKDQMAAVAEAQVLSCLDSAYIVRYYDSYLHEGKLHIVTEFCDGGSLHALIKAARRPLPEDTIWRVLLCTALALHHMHGRRMLHRDVKTMNIFVSLTANQHSQQQQQQFKLGDVGVSKVLEEGCSHAITLIGTPYYLSPELAQELPYGPPSDIWALGVVLYECATCKHPFDAQSQASLIMKILQGRYEPVVGLSTELTAIIHRCLSRAAARRPSAETLLSLPAVRTKAVELGIDLSAGLGGATQSSSESGRMPPQLAQKQLPTYASPQPRRLSCPATPSPKQPLAGPAVRHKRGGINSALAEGVAAVAAGKSPGRSTPVERHRPPLPPIGVSSQRRSLQADLCKQGPPPSPPQQLAAGTPDADEAPSAAQRQPKTAATQAPNCATTGSSPGHSASVVPAVAPPCRYSHFNLQQHLQKLSVTAQWLAYGGASSEQDKLDDSSSTCLQVQRSAKSESSLPDRRQAVSGELSPDPRVQPKYYANGAAATESDVAKVAVVKVEELEDVVEKARVHATQLRLRQRCVDLLGSEALFDELHRLAKAAVEAGSGKPRERNGGTQSDAGSTLAAIGDRLIESLGRSEHAAEALHSLLRLLYHEA